MILFYSGHGAGYAPKHPSNPENCPATPRASVMLTYYETHVGKPEARRLRRLLRQRRKAAAPA